MTLFRPCIDLHHGCVKQIVGGSLADGQDRPIENFVADRPAEWFAAKYQQDGLTGGHVIQLGPGNDAPARAALAAFPGGLQLGGGVTADNAPAWLDAGASHVIVTSWLFDGQGHLLTDRLRLLRTRIGRQRIVIDLSCRRTGGETDGGGTGRPTWRVAMNRWQTLTEIEITSERLQGLAEFADEFLIHAADVEGLCQGIDAELVTQLGRWGGLPMVYAGGVACLDDVHLVQRLSGGAVDVTVGSALDLFGGQGVRYSDLVAWNRRQS